MPQYSEEQLRRKAHLENGGTLANYDRSHYPKKEETKMKLTITSMSGNTSTMSLPTKEDVYYFIDLYKSSLKKNQRVKVTCDLLGIDGYLQGTAPIREKGK
jgi:hypothetical protein